MLKKFNEEIQKIISESTTNSYNTWEELQKDIEDGTNLKEWKTLKSNNDFIQRLKNTNKSLLEQYCDKIWSNYVEKYNDGQPIKEDAKSFYNFLKEIIQK